MLFKVSSVAALLTLGAAPASAFVPKASQIRALPVVKKTSTTLYYRDDVPPIGSAPTWETPNDFNQFLTQCTIQSFTFLLESLRDDISVRWLDDFTQPVMEKHASSTSSAEDSSAEKLPPPKVSLTEAAQTALAETDKTLQGNVKFPDTPLDVVEPTENYYEDFAEANLAADTFAPPETEEEQFWEEPNLQAEQFDATPEPPTEPYYNTGVDQLYSNTGIPRSRDPPIVRRPFGQDQAPPMTKPNYSPFGRKPNAVPPTPFGGAPPGSTYIPFYPKPKDQEGYSPYGDIPKSNIGNFAPVPTSSSLYGYGGGEDPQEGSGVDEPVAPHGDNPNANIGGFAPVPTSSSLYGYGGGESPEAPTQPVAPHGDVPNSNIGGFAPVPTSSSLYGGEGVPQASGDEGRFMNDPVANEPVTGSVSSEAQRPLSLLKYHGLGILNNTRFPTWDSYFEQLVDQPKEYYLVESAHPQAPDIELDLDPAALCRRMIEVRSQISEEFEHDLEVIADMGELTLMSYNKMLAEIKEQQQEEELQQQKDGLEKLMNNKAPSLEEALSSNHGAQSTEDESKSAEPQIQRANLNFLERAVGETDKNHLPPSPLRKGNFDLLCLLATQEGIHRVLNDPSRRARVSPEHGSHQFLQDFYVTRLLSHFSGDQPYGRADDFVEELLKTAPLMISVGNDDKPEDESSLAEDSTYLVDPVMVADTILKERAVVALEWKQHLATTTKEDHMALQRMVLAKVMDSTTAECEVVGTDGTDVAEEDPDFDSCFE